MRSSGVPADPVTTIARVAVGMGIAIVGLGFWLVVLGGSLGAARCAGAGTVPDRGCDRSDARPMQVDPGTAAPVFFVAGGIVAAGGTATLLARRMRAGSTRRRS
jgi:uncharacterized membrane protein